MLALIAIANISWFLWGHEGTVGMTPHVPAMGPLDTAVQIAMTIAVDHRAMPLFAFLFGYGMVQFYRSRIDCGMEPRIVRVMLRRRHWAMLLMGLLHAALLFYGDILGAYAVAGLLLVWTLFGRRTRTLIVWASVIAGVLTLFAVFSLIGMLSLLLLAPPEAVTSASSTTPYANDRLRDLAYSGPYLWSILNRMVLWAPSSIAAGLMGAPLPILLGWIAARHRLLEEPWRYVPALRRIAIGGITAGWLTGLPDALVIAGAIPLPEGLSWGFYGLNVLGGTACGIGYAAAFALLALRLERRRLPEPSAASPDREGRRALRAERAAAHRGLSPAERAYGDPAAEAPAPSAASPALAHTLAAVGQRSLTSYLFQSLLLAPLMAAWGLGLAPHLSTWSAVAIAFGAWLLTLPMAAWMDARGMRGPAEKLLRRMTYGTHDLTPHGTASAAAPATSAI